MFSHLYVQKNGCTFPVRENINKEQRSKIEKEIIQPPFIGILGHKKSPL